MQSFALLLDYAWNSNEGIDGYAEILTLVAVVLGRPLFIWRAASGRVYAMRPLAGATALPVPATNKRMGAQQCDGEYWQGY